MTTTASKRGATRESAISRGQALERLLVQALKGAKWKITQTVDHSTGELGLDLTAERSAHRLLIQLKVFGEGRRDRLEPLLAQAILEIRAAAAVASASAIPVAVIGAPAVSEKIATELLEFAARVAPEVGVGVIDQKGLRRFQGHGLESMNADPPEQTTWNIASYRPTHEGFLFTDTNQWLLKLMLAPLIPDRELLDIRSSEGVPIEIPSSGWQSALQLATVAEVAPRTVGRFLALLRQDSHLADTRRGFELVRIEALLSRWSGVLAESVQDVPAWLMGWASGRDEGEVWREIRRVSAEDSVRLSRREEDRGFYASRPKYEDSLTVAVGLFAAANLLGVGHVLGVPTHLYVYEIDGHAVRSLGVELRRRSEQPPDLFLRMPYSSRAVFRCRIIRDGCPVTDVVQAYVDLLSHPTRGAEQAEVFWEKYLQHSLKGR